jgi:7-carboxy-7-deazaguanine synthase
MSTLLVSEIFHSIQGESTQTGRPCVFVRLAGCDLACSWCDTAYAREGGTQIEIEQVLDEVLAYDCDLVEITGGEPLLQEAIHPLAGSLLDRGKTVMIETGGHHDITGLDPRIRRVVDVKTPSSGESAKMRFENFADLRAQDEVKFVIRDRADFEWALACVAEHRLGRKCPVLFAPLAGELPAADLARWILEAKVPVRLQIQLHKLLWPDVARGA